MSLLRRLRSSANYNVLVLFFLGLFQISLQQHPNFTKMIPKYRPKEFSEIKAACKKHKIVPDVLARYPLHYLQASHKNKVTPQLGNILDPNPLDCFPFIVQWPTRKNTLYTLLMMDPDYPSRDNPYNGAFLHWLVGNIPDSAEDYPMPDIFESTLMTRYLGPMPEKGTGFHRYIFLAYEQNHKIRFREPDLEIEPHDPARMNFSIRDFTRKYRLGTAHAIGFYLAEWIKPPPSTTFPPWDFTPEEPPY